MHGVRDAIRVIKQLVTTTFEADGAVIMHAAAFAADGRVVALVGGKGSGKTTTMLAAVESGATLISNDRLYAWPIRTPTWPPPRFATRCAVLASPHHRATGQPLPGVVSPGCHVRPT
jgi:ABC-type hemin transport system ATPase subunit